jgi:ketosteroid isomerase-like protein
MNKKINRIAFSIFGFALLVFALSSFNRQSTENQDSTSDYKAINEVLDQQLKAWNDGSVDGFMEGYLKSDSTLFMSMNGPQYGWEKLRQMYHKSFPNREKMGNLTFEIERFHSLEGKSYLVIGRWVVDQKTAEKSGYFTLLFKWIDSRWQIVMDHTFSDPKKKVE